MAFRALQAFRYQWGVWLISFLVAVISLEAIQHTQDNTLLNNRRWIVYKKRVRTELMSVEPYFDGPQALAGNHLNLHAWHGYQEVLFRAKVEPEEVSFDFFLGANAYLVFIFNKDFSDYHGIRFSDDNDRPGAFLYCDIGGKFITKMPFDKLSLSPDKKHHASVFFTQNGVAVSLDGEHIGDFPCPIKHPQWVGFRGGSQTVWVDNVSIRDTLTNTHFKENFRNLGLSLGPCIKTAFLTLLAQLFLFLILYLWYRNQSNTLSALIAINLCVISGLFTANFYITHVSNTRYPLLRGQLAKKEKALLDKRLIQKDTEFRAGYTLPKPEDVRRIMFLGSSQTHGCGAQEPEDCFVSLIETKLNQSAKPGEHFECMKAALPGGTSDELLNGYEHNWIQYAPELVIVNLGCNDKDISAFETNLRRIVTLNNGAGIKTLFVLEALSDETVPQSVPNHAIMARVAQELNVPCINNYNYLCQLRDSGFLFWDVVHLSSYGHQLTAQDIWPAIQDLLQGTSKQVTPPANGK
ncbi:MAG TPA: SGNH/GDSL hydrolase family protein [Candidatus Hydrogenedentes bacterium]|nr:SGNH/GDSL hydrolase family protein [Candidatus Hydrogenedentota bacterium]